MFLLSRLDEHTSTALMSVFFFVLGFALGLIIQVLVIAVQNSADFADLGTATSAATFFRSIGGSFGVSVFGAIFSNRLAGELASALRGVPLPSGFRAASAEADPALLKKLPGRDQDRRPARLLARPAPGVPVRDPRGAGRVRPVLVPA